MFVSKVSLNKDGAADTEGGSRRGRSQADARRPFLPLILSSSFLNCCCNDLACALYFPFVGFLNSLPADAVGGTKELSCHEWSDGLSVEAYSNQNVFLIAVCNRNPACVKLINRMFMIKIAKD